MNESIKELEAEFQLARENLAYMQKVINTSINAATELKLRMLAARIEPIRITRITFKQAAAYYDGSSFRIEMEPYGANEETAAPLEWLELTWWARYPAENTPPPNASPELVATVLEITELCAWLMETTRGPEQPILF